MQISDIQVIENLLPESYFSEIKALFTSPKFSWYYTDNLYYGPESANFASKWQKNDPLIKNTYGFTHIARDESNIDSQYQL